MSPSSQESKLAQLREALAQVNSEFFLTLAERKALCLRIQEYKENQGRYSHYDPSREKEVFTLLKIQLDGLSIKELLAFSLVMEDHALTMAPGSYPSWSSRIHLTETKTEMFEMINPLLIKVSHPELFSKLGLISEFQFLRDF